MPSKRKLKSGYESVGHLDGFEDGLSPAPQLDERGATVTLPLLGSGELYSPFHGDEREAAPEFVGHTDDYPDLMCRVHGCVCLSRISSIKREDDQPYLGEGDESQTGRAMAQPTFGRSVVGP